MTTKNITSMCTIQKLLIALTLSLCFSSLSQSQEMEVEHSVARQWNDELMAAIRIDFARPTVHARNLFHSSALMYDLWAVFDTTADTFFLGKNVGGFRCEFSAEAQNTFRALDDHSAARREAISYGMYRLLQQRFANSPGSRQFPNMLRLMIELGFSITNISLDYTEGDPAALGNYLADCIIRFGLQDGANEQNFYLNPNYITVNPPLNPAQPGNPELSNPNRWQPLELNIFVDQSGNETSTPEFLSAEWGRVIPFSLEEEQLTIFRRDGVDYRVFNDPGAPALIDSSTEAYQWNHSLVVRWSAHLDPNDGVTCDISPASIGNTAALPDTFEEFQSFYDSVANGCSVTDQGYEFNPATGQAYETQTVLRGDYTRVLAEFWADGPDSETPPGHWFVIVNEAVHDHPEFEKRFEGLGNEIDDLEWDVKMYFTLGGAMHDAAISAWSIKGWYDYIRPISAIRYMAELGQSTEPSSPNYHPQGIPLVDNIVALVETGDPLLGENQENLNKIKLYAWRGPDYIDNEETDTAGVGWILAENWWPYQRPNFVTPPFAGYVSGHSTFSRAAAELLTLFTGDEFFPGGIAQFTVQANEFLVFEDGPSADITLQWASYRDASDQTSLSRIWGGIHPPIDDIPGRRIGIEVGTRAFEKAKSYFLGNEEDIPPKSSNPKNGGGATFWILIFLASAFYLKYLGNK